MSMRFISSRLKIFQLNPITMTQTDQASLTFDITASASVTFQGCQKKTGVAA